MKYIFVQLLVMQDGYEHSLRTVLSVKDSDDLQQEVNRYASEFWGEGTEKHGGWYFLNGEIYVKVMRYIEIPKEVYDVLYFLFYRSNQGDTLNLFRFDTILDGSTNKWEVNNGEEEVQAYGIVSALRTATILYPDLDITSIKAK